MTWLDARRLPTLSAERVRLRWLRQQDADALFRIYCDPEVTRYWSTPPMRFKAEARRLVREVHEEHSAGHLHEWGLAETDTDQVIGTCTLFNLDRDNRRAEVGFALGRTWWGRGLMAEGLTMLLDFCFARLELRRLEADVDPRNHASIRLLEQLGFRREGLLRERWNVGGELQDAAFYGLLARGYRPLRR